MERSLHFHWAGGEEPFAGLDALVEGLWRRRRRAVNSDVRDDCQVEAELVVWLARERLAGLPEAERAAYAASCARHAVARVLRLEIRATEQCSPPPAGDDADGTLEGTSAHDTEAEALARCPLQDQVSLSELAAALALLPPRDRELLDRTYRLLVADDEIAAAFRLKAAAVRQRRRRAVAKLRQRLQLDGAE